MWLWMSGKSRRNRSCTGNHHRCNDWSRWAVAMEVRPVTSVGGPPRPALTVLPADEDVGP